MTAPGMSRAQSPTMTHTEITLNSLCEKVIKINDKLQNLEARVDNRPIPPTSRITERIYPQLPEELLTETQEIEKIEKYEKCLPMIPEFDGTNAEQFINMILRVQTILTQNQHQYLLLGILSQKIKGKAALAVRADTISSIPKLIEKVKFLYGKTIDVSALSVKRDLCKQRASEAIDDFIERFSKIHDDIITAINTSTYAFGGTTMSEVRENFARDESIRAFKRNVKRDISTFLHCKQIDTIQEAFEFARMYDLETRYSNMFRGDINQNKERQGRQEWKKREFKPSVQCDFCKRYGHKEEECRAMEAEECGFSTGTTNNQSSRHIINACSNSGEGETIRPMVRLKFDELPETGFLIDTGSEITIVSENKLDNETLDDFLTLRVERPRNGGRFKVNGMLAGAKVRAMK